MSSAALKLHQLAVVLGTETKKEILMEHNTLSTVQELASSNNGVETIIPDEFVVKNSVKANLDSSDSRDVVEMDVPIIDMDLLLSSSPEAEEELFKFRTALSSWGCFQAINHGIEHEFLDQMRETNKNFFRMPLEEKLKYLKADDDFQGYGIDQILNEGQARNWNDRIALFVYPETIRNLKLWPQEHGFSETLHEYTLRTKAIVEVMLKAMARSLHLESDPFTEQNGDDWNILARVNFYPRCPTPELVYGIKPHYDGTMISTILQDREVEGLQFFKDEKWVKVPIIPHALLILVGDQGEIMSNGVFKSPLHRVMTNPKQERIAISMFCGPHPDREIGPADELIDESRPRKYRNIKNYQDFSHQCLLGFHGGKEAIDAAKI